MPPDRKVRVRLSASVDEYTTSVNRAAKVTENLQDKAERFERRYKARLDVEVEDGELTAAQAKLDQIDGKRVTAKVDVDGVTKAYSALDNLERKIDRMTGKRATIVVDHDTRGFVDRIKAQIRELERMSIDIPVNADTDTFRGGVAAQIAALERELEAHIQIDPQLRPGARALIEAQLAGLRAQLQVHVDNAQATRDLARTEAQLNRLNGRTATARVRIDDRGVSRNVQAISSAVAALGPAAVAAGAVAAGALITVGNAAVSAAAGIGVAALALYGTGDALQALNKFSDEYTDNSIDAAKQRNTAARSNVSSARAVESAERGVESAQRGVVAANRAVVEASRNEARAHDEVREALEDLNRARQQAIRDMEDMRERSTDLTLDAEDAEIGLIEARQNLATVTADSTSTELDLRKARLEVAKAEDRVSDVVTDTARSRADLNDAEAKGVDGMDSMVAARRRVTDAEQGVVDAQIATAQAVEAVTVAMEGVSDAQEAVSAAQQSAATSGGALADVFTKQSAEAKKLQQTMSKLGPDGREFVLFLYSMKPVLNELRSTSQKGFLPGFQEGITQASYALPEFTNLADKSGTAMGDFATRAGNALSNPFWRGYVNFLADDANPTFDQFGSILGNLAEATAGMQMAWAPFAHEFGEDLVDLTQKFSDWAVTLQNRQGIQDFSDYTLQIMPDVVDTLGSLLAMLGALANAAEPISPAVLAAIRALGDAIAFIAGLPLIGPTLIATAVALGALNRVMRLLMAIKYSTIIQGLMGTGAAAATAGAGAQAGSTKMAAFVGKAGLVGAALITLNMLIPEGTSDNKAYAGSLVDASGGLDNMSGSLLSLNDAFNKAKQGSSGFLGGVREGLGGTVTANVLGVNGLLDTERAEDEDAIGKKRGQFIAAIEAEIARNRQLIDQYPQVATALRNYRNAQQEFGETSREAALALGPLQSALNGAAEAQDVLAGKTSEAMKAARAQADMFLAEIDASVAYKSAILDISDAVGAEGFTRSLDENTRAGQSNITMLTSLADAAAKDLEQKVASGKYTREELIVAIQEHNDALVIQAGQLGATEAEAAALVTQLRLTEGNFIPNFYAPTLPGVKAGVDLYLEALGKTAGGWAAMFTTDGLVNPGGAISQTQTLINQLYGLTSRDHLVNVKMTREFADAIWAPFGSTAANNASGGQLRGPGTGTSDSIPLWGSDREWVINARESERQGYGKMNALNEGRADIVPRFAAGGQIGSGGSRLDQGTVATVVSGLVSGDVMPGMADEAVKSLSALKSLINAGLGPLASQLTGMTVPAIVETARTMLEANLGMEESTLSLRDLSNLAWQNIMDTTGRNIGQVVGPQFDSFHQGMDAIQNHAANMASWVGTQYDKLRAFSADPIRWMINNPYNGKGGIIEAWNNIDTMFALGKHLNPIIPGFRRGGALPGYSRTDDQLIAARSGESIFVPEFTSAVGGPSTVDRWNRAAEQGPAKLAEAMGLGAYGGGGTVPFASQGWDYLTQTYPGIQLGGRGGGSVPGSDHPKGLAIDAMIPGYRGAGRAMGDQIASEFVTKATAHMTKYVIWWEKIWQGRGWGSYSHPGGSDDRLAHRNHVHISFLRPGEKPLSGGSGVGMDPAMMMQDAFKPARAMLDSMPGQFGQGYLTGAGKVSGHQNIDRMIAWGTAKFWEGLAQTEGMGMDVGPPGAGVERWRGVVHQALGLTGQPLSMDNTTLRRMNQESGGNPRAINNWDSNAKKGTPSKGLMQVIDPTFRSYWDPRTPNDIWNPLSNVTASMRYALARYGSLPAAYNRAGGYDDGGVAKGTGIMMKNVISPERVLGPSNTRSFDDLVAVMSDPRFLPRIVNGGNGAQAVQQLDVQLSVGGNADGALGTMLKKLVRGGQLELTVNGERVR